MGRIETFDGRTCLRTRLTWRLLQNGRASGLNGTPIFEYTKETWRYVALRGRTAGARRGNSRLYYEERTEGSKKRVGRRAMMAIIPNVNFCRLVLRRMRRAHEA